MGAVGDEVAPGGGPAVVGREIGTWRAGIGADDRVGIEQPLEGGDDALGPDRRLIGRGERLEGGEFRCPSPPGARHAVVARSRAATGQRRHDGLERQACVAGERDFGRIVRADDRRIGIDVDDAGVRPRRTPALGRHRTGAATDVEHEVGLVDHGAGRRDAAVRTDHAERARIVLRDRALAGNGRRDGHVEHVREPCQRLHRARDHHAAAADGDRVAGGKQGVGGSIHRPRVGRGGQGREHLVAGIGPDLVRRDGVFLRIEGKRQVNGARPPGGHLAKGPADHGRQAPGVVQRGVPLGQGPEHRDLVEFRQGISPARGGRDVRVYREHRDRTLVRLHNAWQDVCRTAAGGALADAGPAGDAGIGVGHVAGVPLVAGQEMGYAVVEAVERVVQWKGGVAAQAEDVPDAIGFQHLHQRLGAVERVRLILRIHDPICPPSGVPQPLSADLTRPYTDLPTGPAMM